MHVELVRSRGGGERKGERGGDGTDALERRRHGHLHCQRLERQRPRLAPLLRPAMGRLSAAPASRATAHITFINSVKITYSLLSKMD